MKKRKKKHEADIRFIVLTSSTPRCHFKPGSTCSHSSMGCPSPQTSVLPHPTMSPSPGRSQGPLEVGLSGQCPPHPCQIPELQELKILQPLLLLAGTQADFAPVTEKQRPRREQDWHSRQPLPEGLLPDLGSLQTMVISFTPHQNSSSGKASVP